MLYFVSALVLAAVPVLLLVQAMREEYLLVLTWNAHGTLVFERKQGERYRLISPFWVPMALARFATLRAIGAFAWSWQRARQVRPAKVVQPAVR